MISRRITKDEIEKIFLYAWTQPVRNRKKLLCMICLLCIGLRAKEVVNVRVLDIIENRKVKKWIDVYTLKQGKKKNFRQVSIPESIKSILQICIDKDKEFVVYGNKGEVMNRQSVWDRFSKIKSEIGLKGKVTTHSFRRTYATMLLEGGVEILAIKELLGHRNIYSTLRYLNTSKKEKLYASEVLDKIYAPVNIIEKIEKSINKEGIIKWRCA